MTLALNNQDKPNAVDNTDIIIAYDGDERTSNLQIAPIIQTRLPLPLPPYLTVWVIPYTILRGD